MDEKRKKMEPLHNELGKIRDANNAVREKGFGLCSSEEELNNIIKSLEYRISHESLSLDEEKRLMKEIKQLQGTRSKVIASASMRAKFEGTFVKRDAIEDQVKVIGLSMEEVKKEREEVRAKIKQLEEQKAPIDSIISSLENKKVSLQNQINKSIESRRALRASSESLNACFFENRNLLIKAKEHAAKKDIAALESLYHSEIEKFMKEWNKSKTVREDYERRILSSLDNRQLTRDGRIRNPDEQPIISPDTHRATESQPLPAVTPSAKPAPAINNKQQKESSVNANVKPPVIEDSKAKAGNLEGEIARKQERETAVKAKEIDLEKLKEMKREEEIAKNKLALERKKKQAEKSAAKAATRAQKEADKKLKEKEKRAKKKAGASAPDTSDEQTETESMMEEQTELEPESKDENTVSPPATTNKLRQDKEKRGSAGMRYRKGGQAHLPRSVLKKKKSQSYFSWGGPLSAAVVAVVLALLLGGFAYYYKYYYAVNGKMEA